MDYNIQEDDEFEQWHDRFLQSITTEVVVEVDDQEAAKAHHQDVLGRLKSPQKQFLITLLRRMEDLVPKGQSWVLI
ncbi:MAG: hypothetical protein J3Q66DRAFT_407671 [Benniella sp.]|nr:MAG: hypothetical protein J3Q66DRAFT_408061 [Benniella sp.]KAK3805637.1 MAG: hypothetical protein J3Q66DRAFT_407671 [Benniella sp.]